MCVFDLLTDAQPACAADADSWCAHLWQTTGIGWLSQSADWLIAKPLNIVVVLIVGALIRLVLHRMIDRLTKERDGGKLPAILRPLRERAPQSLVPVSARRAQRARTIGSVLKSIVSFLVWGIAFVMILGDLGFNLTPILASAGVVGVAVGFGAQNLVKDFLTGVFMLLEDQYGVGDVVDVGDATGTVESVGLRITTLRDINGTVWYVRNGAVNRVGNSTQGFAMALVDVPIAYGTDVNEALSLLGTVAGEVTEREPLNANVLAPPTVLGVQSVTAEHITLRLTVKVRPAKQWATERELRREIMAAFDSAGFHPPLGRLSALSEDE
jgi:moderate conductance mechanosensitive channel